MFCLCSAENPFTERQEVFFKSARHWRSLQVCLHEGQVHCGSRRSVCRDPWALSEPASSDPGTSSPPHWAFAGTELSQASTLEIPRALCSCSWAGLWLGHLCLCKCSLLTFNPQFPQGCLTLQPEALARLAHQQWEFGTMRGKWGRKAVC